MQGLPQELTSFLSDIKKRARCLASRLFLWRPLEVGRYRKLTPLRQFGRDKPMFLLDALHCVAAQRQAQWRVLCFDQLQDSLGEPGRISRLGVIGILGKATHGADGIVVVVDDLRGTDKRGGIEEI